MDFIPHTPEETKQMLDLLELKDLEALFSHLPKNLKVDKIGVGEGCSEIGLRNHISEIAEKNNNKKHNFLGAGRYNHYIPSLVAQVCGRPEFYTNYTPYQAEVSQGILQVLFEFQSYMCELTGMDVSNAGMYDGATALAESALLAVRKTGLTKIIYPSSLNPLCQSVLETYAGFCGFETKKISVDGRLTQDDLEKYVDEKTAGLIMQNPNFFGIIEDNNLAEFLKDSKTFFIAHIMEATSLGLLSPPKEADIVCGDAQAFGNPMNFGGPSIGFLCTKQEYVRNLPGRIVGETTDSKNKRGYVLTFQTREQHIRREKATSNICTAESLNALAATSYLALMGSAGLREVAEISHSNAVYLKDRLIEQGAKIKFKNPFFNEFVVTGVDVGGLDLSKFYPELNGARLFCTTELDSTSVIDDYIQENFKVNP